MKISNKPYRVTCILLLIFTIHLLLSCSLESKETDPAVDLLNSLSLRLKSNDYITSTDVDYMNPYTPLGKNLGIIYQNILKHPLVGNNIEIYRGSYLVPQNDEDIRRLKAITKYQLEMVDVVFSEKDIDRFIDRAKDTQLTTDGLTQYLADGVKDKSITTVEHDLIVLELQEMAATSSNLQLTNIIRTFEYEVLNSNISSSSKDKIMMFNAMARNSLINIPSHIANERGPGLFHGTFLKTTPVTIITTLVIFAIASLIDAWQDPNCDSFCQSVIVSQTGALVASGALVCEAVGAGSKCPCYPPCHLSGIGMCQCP